MESCRIMVIGAGIEPVIGGFLTQRASIADLGWYLCCLPKQAFQLKIDWLVIWEVFTLA